MTPQDAARFDRLIRDRLAEIEAENLLGHDAQAIVQLDQQSVGRLSRMDALQNQAMAKAQQQRRDTQALRLAAALRRIEAGEFGYCGTCGEDVPLRRLELDPAAMQCVSCASR